MTRTRLALICTVLATATSEPRRSPAADSPPLWTAVQVATADGSVLPRGDATVRALTTELGPSQAPRGGANAQAALLNFDGVVLVTLITLADQREETYHVPMAPGDAIDIFHDQVIIGGTVLAFSPLTRTVLTSAPLLGSRKLVLKSAPSPERLRDEALTAAREFTHKARERGERIGSRAARARVQRRLLGGPLLEAGAADGVRPGLVIAVADDDGRAGMSCSVKSADEHSAALDCPAAPGEHSTGQYLRSVGIDSERYQVGTVSITSAKAREVLGASLGADEVAAAFVASDRLSERGLTVLPPGGAQGERATLGGVREFAERYGLSDAELDRLSLRFPPADVKVDLVVDGYNTAVVGSGGATRQRAHKAWATATDSRGRRAEGIAVVMVDEIEDWQVATPQAADAREAIRDAVRCATSRVLGEEASECKK